MQRLTYLAFLLTLSLTNAAANVTDSQFPFDASKPLKVGQGLDLTKFGAPRQECLNFELEFETAGAINTKVDTEILTTYEELSNTLNIDESRSVSADVSWAKYKAKGSFSTESKFSDFKRNESSSIFLVVNVFTEWGKRQAKNISLKNEFRALISDGKHDEFKQQCGTHLIIAERRKSQISLLIQISNLTEDSKKIVEKKLKNAIEASGPIKKVDVKVNAESKKSWSNTFKSSKKYGDISVKIFSKGAIGLSEVEDLSPALSEDLPSLLKQLSQYASKFTQNSSAISHYLMLNNTSFGLDQPMVNFEKLNILAYLFDSLEEIDFRINELNKIRDNYPEIFELLYVDSEKKHAKYKKYLAGSIEECIQVDSCPKRTKKPPKFHPINDFLVEDEIKVDCTYANISTINANGKSDDIRVLSNIRLFAEGKIRMPGYLQYSTAVIRAIGGAGSESTPLYNPPTVKDPDKRISKFFTTVDNHIFNLDQLTSKKGGVLSIDSDSFRDKVLSIQETAYVIEIKLKDGTSLLDYLGYPLIENCPIKKS